MLSSLGSTSSAGRSRRSPAPVTAASDARHQKFHPATSSMTVSDGQCLNCDDYSGFRGVKHARSTASAREACASAKRPLAWQQADCGPRPARGCRLARRHQADVALTCAISAPYPQSVVSRGCCLGLLSALVALALPVAAFAGKVVRLQAIVPAGPPPADPAAGRRAARHGRTGADGVSGHQAGAVQGPGRRRHAQLPAQAGRHPDPRRGSARRIQRHRRRHERQPGLHRRQADGRGRLRLELRQGAAGRRDARSNRCWPSAAARAASRTSSCAARRRRRAGGRPRGRAPRTRVDRLRAARRVRRRAGGAGARPGAARRWCRPAPATASRG